MSFIETERLLIRTWQLPRDLDDALAVYGDPDVMHFIPIGALDRDQTQGLVQRMIDRNEAQGYGIWPVVHKGDHRVIGECGVTQIPGWEPDVEIAWIFNKAYHGQGYATEAARAVIGYAFSELEITRLYALIDRFNAPSIAVANRLRMRYDRIIRAYKRDLMRYELRASDHRVGPQQGASGPCACEKSKGKAGGEKGEKSLDHR